MLIVWVILIILILSIGFSYLSLRSELKKSKHEEKVKDELAKGRVLFYDSSSGSESDSSSGS